MLTCGDVFGFGSARDRGIVGERERAGALGRVAVANVQTVPAAGVGRVPRDELRGTAPRRQPRSVGGQSFGRDGEVLVVGRESAAEGVGRGREERVLGTRNQRRARRYGVGLVLALPHEADVEGLDVTRGRPEDAREVGLEALHRTRAVAQGHGDLVAFRRNLRGIVAEMDLAGLGIVGAALDVDLVLALLRGRQGPPLASAVGDCNPVQAHGRARHGEGVLRDSRVVLVADLEVDVDGLRRGRAAGGQGGGGGEHGDCACGPRLARAVVFHGTFVSRRGEGRSGRVVFSRWRTGAV